LRRAVGVENEAVKVLGSHKGHLEILSPAEYQRQLELGVVAADNLEELEGAGLL
jgi:hypothetical protein